MKIHAKLTRGTIDHVMMWAKVYKQQNNWTKWDTNIFNMLVLFRKKISKDDNNRAKIRKILEGKISNDEIEKIIEMSKNDTIKLKLIK